MDFLDQAVSQMKSRAPNFHPKVGLILGSGLSKLAEQLTDKIAIPFHEISGLPQSHVEGHCGQFVLGFLKGTPVLCLNGRLHMYEGVSYEAIALLIRIVKKMGCEEIIITNASGSLRKDVTPGHLMLITDHINFQPSNPLVGLNDPAIGPRFVGMDRTYDLHLRETVHKAAKNLNIPIAEGVYISVLGPCFETPAEIRAFRLLGADAVGMSTVPEVIAARHCGLKVVVIATITNFAAGMIENIELSHEDTLVHAQEAAGKLSNLVVKTIEMLSQPSNQQLMSVIDLTQLERPDDLKNIVNLCDRAIAHSVAAVCVYPEYLKLIKDKLQGVRLSTVVNFPSGLESIEKVVSDIHRAIQEGAEEIDLVFPYHDYLKGAEQKSLDFVRAAKKACGPSLLKVILETGEVPLEQLPEMAAAVIDAGADFLKTSTGKVAVGATPKAVSILLRVIKEKNFSVGLKVSGGVRTKKDALLYWKLAKEAGLKMDARHFRIGASGLLRELVVSPWQRLLIFLRAWSLLKK